MDADMLRDISEEGFAGAACLRVDRRVVQVHLEHRSTSRSPRDRRQLWRNDLTNEEHFGIVADGPGPSRDRHARRQRDEWARDARTAGCWSRPARARGARRPTTRRTSTFGWSTPALANAPITLGFDVRARRQPGPAGPPRSTRRPTSR